MQRTVLGACIWSTVYDSFVVDVRSIGQVEVSAKGGVIVIASRGVGEHSSVELVHAESGPNAL